MSHLLHTLAVLLFVFGVQATPLHAQSNVSDGRPVMNAATVAKEAPIAANSDMSIGEIKRKMGLLFYPMVALSVLTVVLIFFNAFTIRQGTVVSDAFMNAADALIRKQDYLGLLAVCNRRSECVACVTSKALDFATKNPTASFDEVREVTEAEGSRQASLLLQRVAYLGDIGAISPMMGLLGTVFGLISSFNHLSQGSQAMGVASGVYEALFCTAAGLIIGIPALMIYAMYRGKVQRLVSELESASTHIMALLAAQYKRAARSAATRQAFPPGGHLGAEGAA